MKLISLEVNGDKSIAHRAVLASLLSEPGSVYKIFNIPDSQDVEASVEAVISLGAIVRESDDGIEITTPYKLNPCRINCRNSGTTMRLLMGILAGRMKLGEEVILYGDESLSKRPMDRVSLPLMMMGAHIVLDDEKFSPVEIIGVSSLSALDYALPIASAQVKSALLMAALSADGESLISGKIQSRNHTENLLEYFGAYFVQQKNQFRVQGGQVLYPQDVRVPGDISSASFWVFCAAIARKQIVIKQVGLNETRLGFIHAAQKMGIDVDYKIRSHEFEKSGELKVKGDWSEMNSIHIQSEEVASLIDEVPLLCILMGMAKGESRIDGLAELKYKESDRFLALQQILKALNIKFYIIAESHSMVIQGSGKLKLGNLGELVDSMDHRVIMLIAILEKTFLCDLGIKYPDMVGISYPEFWNHLEKVYEH